MDPQREPRLTPDLHLDRGHSTGGGPTVFGSCSEHSSAGDRSSNCGCNRAGLSSAMTSRNDARRKGTVENFASTRQVLRGVNTMAVPAGV